MVTRWLRITCIIVIIDLSSRNRLKCRYLKNQKYYLKWFFHFWNLRGIFSHFEKEDQLHSLNTLEVIDSKKYGYLKGRKASVPEHLQESTCSRFPNTDEICTAKLWSYSSINLKQIELGNIFLIHIWNLRIVS